MFSGTVLGFVCVGALLAAAILIAVIDRRERRSGRAGESRFLSRLALGLFLAAFVGGVVVTLVAGVKPRQDTISRKGYTVPLSLWGEGPPHPPQADEAEGEGEALKGGPTLGGTIGSVDDEEFRRLKEKVEADPKDVASRERLGHLYLQQQDFENVFRMAHEALQQNPASVESRVHMGMVFFAMREMDQAFEQFDKALKLDPKNAEALRFKAMVESSARSLSE